MKHVAALAGVGIKTVSRVINGEANVAEATAAKVWDAARTLDYHVDLQAGSLRRADGRTRTIGLLVGSVDNPFAGAVHRAVEDAASPRGVAVLAASMDDDPRREDLAVRTFLQRRVDGLILTTAQARPAYIETLRARGIPAVFVDRDPLAEVDQVASDNREGAAAATAHLIRHGHRRIALLADRLDIETARMRQAGFFDALGAAGIPTSLAPTVTELHTPEQARAALVELLARETPPTAVFSSQNLVTVGALHALREAGLQHRVALVGFDDLPLADLLEPGITVASQNPQEIGRRAVELLFARLEGEESASRRIVVPTTLIPRGSGEIVAPA
jgi:LacI family transcriptional regulator